MIGRLIQYAIWAALANVGQQELAQRMTQDYLDAYADHVNEFAQQLLVIANNELATATHCDDREQVAKLARYSDAFARAFSEPDLNLVFAQYAQSDDAAIPVDNQYIVDIVGKEVPDGH